MNLALKSHTIGSVLLLLDEHTYVVTKSAVNSGTCSSKSSPLSSSNFQQDQALSASGQKRNKAHDMKVRILLVLFAEPRTRVNDRYSYSPIFWSCAVLVSLVS